MARTKAEKDALQAEADKLTSKLRGNGNNVLVATVAADDSFVFSMEWPDEIGRAFQINVPFVIPDGVGNFVTAEQYIKSGAMENKIADVLLKKQKGLIKRADGG